MYSVGEIISTNRKRLGMSQLELSKRLQEEGFSQSSKVISKWEKNVNEPSVTIFYAICRILGITNMYESYFGINPADPLSALSDAGKEKVLNYIDLLHDSGKYEKRITENLSFRRVIDIFRNAVSAGTGNFLVDGPKETVVIQSGHLVPSNASFGIQITGDSMEPEFYSGQIAWVMQQETISNGEIGIFSINGEAYIKKLQSSKKGVFLISLNEKYAPIKVSENDRFDFFGKVVGKCNISDIPEYNV